MNCKPSSIGKGDKHLWLAGIQEWQVAEKSLNFYHFLPSRCEAKPWLLEKFHREMRLLELSSCWPSGPCSHLGCGRLQSKSESENRSEAKHGIFQVTDSVARVWLDRGQRLPETIICPVLWSQQRISDSTSFTTSFCSDKLVFLNESCNKKFRPAAIATANH